MKVYNLGSLNVDYVYSVDHFVEAGETVSSNKMEIFPGGKGLNQSVALARAGADAVHGALVGDGGEFLAGTLKDSGVDVSKLKRAAGSPGHAIIQLNKNGENCIMIYPGTNRALDAGYVEGFLSDAESGDILLVQNETNCIDVAFRTAKEKGMKIAFNPSPCDEKILKLPLDLVDIWFCNETEGKILFGSDEPDKICELFRKGRPDSTLILTLGESGSVYCGPDATFRQPVYKAKAVDTTAAGDTFTGYFLASLCRGASPREAMDIASRASAITVSRMGASSSIPYIDEIEK
ncbi:MAG: ribokinase [Clostridia bacterium]|nr:ribokinase [Clostridia bacterium]